ncbi:MAG: prolipoprotein diacylglyceryl transferase [Proteobacteria bacterium]|nr:prolipoprotein diacylglyceryl transferase [Pseudomonadota bacterium]
MFAIVFPNIDPVIFQMGSIAIRWYGVSYVIAILLGYWILLNANKKTPILSQESLDSIILYIAFGILIGGRIGYVLFYNLQWIYTNPLQIIKIWEGGMSFHGGLIGVIIIMYIFSKKFNLSFASVMDLLSIVGPIGCFFGRIANFINAELYGRETDILLGVIFPGEDFPRHPSQIYEALLEGLLLFIIMQIIYRKTKVIEYKLMLFSIAVFLYGVFRFLIEFYREPDAHLGFIYKIYTMGQMLSLLMCVTGMILFILSMRNYKKVSFSDIK